MRFLSAISQVVIPTNTDVNVALTSSCETTLAKIQPDYQSLTWKYDGINYFAPLALNTSVYTTASPPGILPYSLNKRSSYTSNPLLVPCTTFTINGSNPLTDSVVADIVSEYETADKYWTSSQFLECLFIQNEGNQTGIEVQQSFMDFLVANGVNYAFISSSFKYNENKVPSTTRMLTLSMTPNIANGPYVASISTSEGGGVSMTPVYTLHTDDYEAFMEGSISNPSESVSHLALHFSLPGTRLPSIIVPSRIPSKTSTTHPLSGLRFAVKDIFHIKGLKTSGGSRSYYEAYSPQNYTTETVQICLNGGAQLIGKTRTIAFALGAPIAGQEVDFLNPWNARGDGYLNTGGSSSGSGAAVTAYDWVDFALGSDTGGSVRFPARYGGLYGYKPTHGIFNITGILVAIAEQDTPGFLTRSPKIFTTLGNYWARNKPLTPLPNTFPKKLLLYADEPLLTQPAAEKLKQEFFTNVSTALNLTTTSINITSQFLAANVSATSPVQDMTSYLYYVYSDQNNVQGWDEIGQPLTTLYQQHFDGASPPTGDPPVNISWTDGQNATTRARYPESQRRRERFADFWNTLVLPVDNETCTESIFAHSYHTPPTLEKVTPAAATLVAPGWWNGVAMNYAGIPEIVVPIGQVKYFSPFTLRTEVQPVTVAFAAAKGCDLVLFDMVDKLVEAGLLKEVLPGKTAFPI